MYVLSVCSFSLHSTKYSNVFFFKVPCTLGSVFAFSHKFTVGLDLFATKTPPAPLNHYCTTKGVCGGR